MEEPVKRIRNVDEATEFFKNWITLPKDVRKLILGNYELTIVDMYRFCEQSFEFSTLCSKHNIIDLFVEASWKKCGSLQLYTRSVALLESAVVPVTFAHENLKYRIICHYRPMTKEIETEIFFDGIDKETAGISDDEVRWNNDIVDDGENVYFRGRLMDGLFKSFPHLMKITETLANRLERVGVTGMVSFNEFLFPSIEEKFANGDDFFYSFSELLHNLDRKIYFYTEGDDETDETFTSITVEFICNLLQLGFRPVSAGEKVPLLQACVVCGTSAGMIEASGERRAFCDQKCQREFYY